MNEKKIYRIGGRNFEFPPSTVAQRMLSATLDVEICKAVADAVTSDTLTIYLDSSVLWSNPQASKFFALHLVPESTSFDKSKVDEITAHFDTCLPEEFDEAFADFLYAAKQSGGKWFRYWMELKQKNNLSEIPSE